MDLITFTLQEQPNQPARLYGLELSAELAVVPLGPITRVPLAPPAIAGTMNHKGHVVVLIDLAWVMGGSSTAPRPGDPSFLVREANCRMVLCVHRILDLHRGELDTDRSSSAHDVLSGRVETAAGTVWVLYLERLVDQLTMQITVANAELEKIASGVIARKRT